jgi:hypothetical protein
LIVTGLIAKEVYIERYNNEGWKSSFPQSPPEILHIIAGKMSPSCCYLAAILLQFPFFRRILVTHPYLGISFQLE